MKNDMLSIFRRGESSAAGVLYEPIEMHER
jgi:hypothetical protein